MTTQKLIIHVNDTTPEKDSIRVDLIGQLAGMDAKRFESFMDHLIQYEHLDVIVDLTALYQIDMKGIGCLTKLYKMQRDKNCEIVFIQDHTNAVMDVIRTTKIHKVLPFNYNTTKIAC